MAKIMELTLTDAQGVILGTWTIGDHLEPDFDPEDPKAETEHDFYADGKWGDGSDFAEEVWDEIVRMYEVGLAKPRTETVP